MTPEEKQKKIEKLEAELDEASAAHNAAFSNSPDGMSYLEFESYMAKTGKKVDALSKELRLIKDPVMTELDEDGDLMTLDEFVECCLDGGFIDYDGSGNYATATHESDIDIYPSDVTSGNYRKDFTHVVWYNR